MRPDRTASGTYAEHISRRCNVLDLGLTDYGKCLEVQRKLLVMRQNSEICDSLILTEHNPVITFGRGYRDALPDLPVPVFQIERGGEGTYHCPGQLVAYPILNIYENGTGIRTLVSRVMGAAVSALRRLGIESEGRFDPVGVWVGGKKIASLGIAVKRWVTFHGIAINLNNELDGFEYINPCGMSASTMTSAKRILGRRVDFDEFRHDFVSAFMESFDFDAERTTLGSISGGADSAHGATAQGSLLRSADRRKT